jgi:DNA-binding IclR family transcriptional regulator
VIAAISISGPVFRMTREKIEKEYIAAVTKTALMISQKLGYLHTEHP